MSQRGYLVAHAPRAFPARPFIALLLLVQSALLSAVDVPSPAALPTIAAAVQELHGQWSGHPFWARLQKADPQFGNNRVLQLVYTPPAAETLGGARLSDCPFVLLDEHLRVVAWNGRDSASNVVPDAQPIGYRVSREVLVGKDKDEHPDIAKRTIAGDRAWDLRLAPLLLALAWHPDSTGHAPLRDLFGPRFAEHLDLTWTADHAIAAGESWTIEADTIGHLKRLLDAHGAPILDITARLDPPATAP